MAPTLALALALMGCAHTGTPAPPPPAADIQAEAEAAHIQAVQAAVQAWQAELDAAYAELVESGGGVDQANALVDRFSAPVVVNGREVPVESETLDRLYRTRDALALQAITTVADPPPWDGGAPQPVAVPDTKAPRLRKVASAKNQVTDIEAWFANKDLVVPAHRTGATGGATYLSTPLPPVPRHVLDRPVAWGRSGEAGTVAVYGDGWEPDIVAVFGPDGTPRRVWDLTPWAFAPGVVAGDEQFVKQGINWVHLDQDVLYVSHSHRTYAASSKGHNAYVSALDVQTGDLRWRSPPLVCNAETFVVADAHVVCGYGFTAEKDFVTVLSRADGRLVQRIGVPSGPEYILRRGDTLYVRTYDRDMAFAME